MDKDLLMLILTPIILIAFLIIYFIFYPFRKTWLPPHFQQILTLINGKIKKGLLFYCIKAEGNYAGRKVFLGIVKGSWSTPSISIIKMQPTKSQLPKNKLINKDYLWLSESSEIYWENGWVTVKFSGQNIEHLLEKLEKICRKIENGEAVNIVKHEVSMNLYEFISFILIFDIIFLLLAILATLTKYYFKVTYWKSFFKYSFPFLIGPFIIVDIIFYFVL